jgi:outer membrane protein TolC
VRQLLYDFGQTSRRVGAQEAAREAAEHRQATRRSELTLRGLDAWSQVFRAQQMVLLNAMNVVARQQIRSFVEERERLGGSSRSDVLRVQARIAEAETALVAAENQLRAAEAGFFEVFSQKPPAAASLLELPAIDRERYRDTAALLEGNRVLRELRAQGRSLELEAAAASSAMFPKLTLEVSRSRRDLYSGGTPGTDSSWGIVANHNLYAGGADQARQAQAQLRSQEALLEVDVRRRQLEKLISELLAEVDSGEASIKARRDAVVGAMRALEVVRSSGRTLADWQQRRDGGLGVAAVQGIIVDRPRAELNARAERRLAAIAAMRAEFERSRVPGTTLPDSLELLRESRDIDAR